MWSVACSNLWAKGKEHTVDRVPQEDSASLQTTLDFINPLVVVLHPRRALALDLTWLSTVPESWGREVLPHPPRVQTPFALRRVCEKAERGAQDGASWWSVRIPVAANVENERAHKENNGGERVCQPEADELLG